MWAESAGRCAGQPRFMEVKRPLIRSIPNSLVVASSIVTGLMQGVVLFLPIQGTHLWPRLVVAPSSSVLGRHFQAGLSNFSVLGRHSRTPVAPRPELSNSSVLTPRPGTLNHQSQAITPRAGTLSYQSSLPRVLLGGSQSIVPGSHQSGGCTESACTDNQG